MWLGAPLAALLTTYEDRHGLRTVRQIINRWAPPKENNTSAYVLAVCSAIGVGPDDPITLHDYDILRPMVDAIIKHEIGGMPYDDRMIEEGLKRPTDGGLLANVARQAETVRRIRSEARRRPAASNALRRRAAQRRSRSGV